MLILVPDFVEAYEGKIVNIHPSLLPKFKGLNTHRRALTAYHDGILQSLNHGCTVHYVDNGVDTGPIIAQARCQIDKTDTENTLSTRVLEMEHRLFPWVVNSIAKGDIYYQAGKVSMSIDARQRAVTLGFLI